MREIVQQKLLRFKPRSDGISILSFLTALVFSSFHHAAPCTKPEHQAKTSTTASNPSTSVSWALRNRLTEQGAPGTQNPPVVIGITASRTWNAADSSWLEAPRHPGQCKAEPIKKKNCQNIVTLQIPC